MWQGRLEKITINNTPPQPSSHSAGGRKKCSYNIYVTQENVNVAKIERKGKYSTGCLEIIQTQIQICKQINEKKGQEN